jgi:hypothetical protein
MMLLLVLLGALPRPGQAQQSEHDLAFSVLFGGLAVAEITGSARETDAAYAAAVQIRATGLAAAFARIRFDMQVEGFRADDLLSPFRYRGAVDTGQRRGRVELHWPPGTGPVLVSEPPDVEDGVRPVLPAEATGAQDRLTLLWRIARPQPEATLCDWQARLFDGARLAALSLDAARIDGDSATCSGAYRRLAGFPEDDLSRAPRFPFELSYRRNADGLWELTAADAASIYGRVRILAKD